MAATNYYFIATSGGSDLNDGRDLLGFGLTNASFTNSTKNLNKVGAFSGYTFTAGDRIYVFDGEDVIAGLYEISSKTDNDNIVLVESISAYDPTDVDSSTGPWDTIPYADIFANPGYAFFLAVMNDGEEFDVTTTITLSESGDFTDGPIIWSGSNSQGLVDGTIAAINYTSASQRNSIVDIAGTNSVFQYILVKNGVSNDLSITRGNGWEANGDNLIFHGCESTDNDGNGFELRSGDIHLFLECYAADNGKDSDADQGMGFKSTRPTTAEPVFFGCVAKDNENTGIQAATGFLVQCLIYSSTSGFHVASGANTRIVINCTLFNSDGDGIFRHTDAGASIFQNNILIGNTYGLDGSTTKFDNVLILNNAFYNNSSNNINGSAYTHETDLDGNPLMERETRNIGGNPFVDTLDDNFQLDIKKTPGLLCIASGAPKDFIGTTMTNSVDRGCSFVQFTRSGTG